MSLVDFLFYRWHYQRIYIYVYVCTNLCLLFIIFYKEQIDGSKVLIYSANEFNTLIISNIHRPGTLIQLVISFFLPALFSHGYLYQIKCNVQYEEINYQMYDTWHSFSLFFSSNFRLIETTQITVWSRVNAIQIEYSCAYLWLA